MPISLASLVASGGEIESANGRLEFEDFSAKLLNAPQSDLSLFQVVPVADGFRIELVPGRSAPSGTQLLLGFEVEAENEDDDEDKDKHESLGLDRIRSMSLEILGVAALGFASAEMTAFADDDDDAPPLLGALFTSTAPGQSAYSATDLASPSREIYVMALLIVGVESVGYAAHPGPSGTEMRFSADPIPEPSSVLLVGIGLLVLGVRARRRPSP